MRLVNCRWLVLAAVAVLTLDTRAKAVMVTNVTTDTLLFFDDFEGLGSSVSHAVYPDGSGDFDPVAQFGQWDIGESSQGDVQVTDYSAPGAFWGDNYLRLLRPGGFTDHLGQFTAPQTQTGDAIHFEWMYYVKPPTSATSYPGFGFLDTDGGLMAHVLLRPDGTVRNVSTPTGLTYTPNQWVKAEMDYVLGETSFLLTIDGASVTTGLYNSHPGNKGVAALRLFGNPAFETYLDATTVPEPATLGLLGVGALGLAVCRRRRPR